MTTDEQLQQIVRVAHILNKMRKARKEKSFVALAPDEIDDLFYALRALASPATAKEGDNTRQAEPA